MTQPLDFNPAARTGRVRAARVFSNVVSPPVMFAVLGLALALNGRSFWTGFGWAALYGLLVSLAPILVVLYLLHTGRIQELHMSNTAERHIPYITAVALALIAFGSLWALDGPHELRCLALLNAVELAALALINIFWLISIHSAGATVMTLIAGLAFGWPVALAALPMVALVVWVRLYLKRHTLGQILGGIALGIISVFGVTVVGCF